MQGSEFSALSPESKRKAAKWALKGIHPDAKYIAKYFIRSTPTSASDGEPRCAKDLDELDGILNHEGDFSNEAPFIELTECEFTDPAKQKIRKFILNFLTTNFSVTNIKSDNDLFDKTTQDKINDLLIRNQHLNDFDRKIKMLFLCSFLGIAAGTFFLYPLFNVIAFLLIYPPVYYLLYRKESQLIHVNTPIYWALMLSIATVPSLMYESVVVIGLSFIGGIASIIINYLRDNLIRNSIQKYAAPNVQLNLEEINSIKQGLAAQRGLFTPLYWTASTWKCPRAYYFGLYNSENILKNKIKLPRPQ